MPLNPNNRNDIDITIINDASTDDTSRYIEKLKQKYRFKLIDNEVNLNQSGSLNKAIECSPNNLFIVLNADDCLLKYTINTVINLLKHDKSIVMVGGNNIQFRDKETLFLNHCLPDKLPYEPDYMIVGPNQAKLYTELNDINFTMSSCSFLRSAWSTVGRFFEFKNRLCSYDDRDFQMRVSALFNVAIITEPLTFYRINSSVGKAQI